MVALPVEAPDSKITNTCAARVWHKHPTPVALVVTVTAFIPDAATAVPDTETVPTPCPPTPVSEVENTVFRVIFSSNFICICINYVINLILLIRTAAVMVPPRLSALAKATKSDSLAPWAISVTVIVLENGLDVTEGKVTSLVTL